MWRPSIRDVTSVMPPAPKPTTISALAREHLVIATAMYREMHMPYWLEQVEAEMRQLG